MKIIVNGVQIDTDVGITLADFLDTKNIDIKSVVIEYNLSILKDVNGIELKENDNIEILRIVGGG